MPLTPLTDVIIPLPRLCGTREAAEQLVASFPNLQHKTVLISARQQSTSTEDYADGLLRQLTQQQVEKVFLIGYMKNFDVYMRQAAQRHQFNNLEVLQPHHTVV